MITDPIFNQQQNLTIRNNGLRKVAGTSKPPSLTGEESSMIQKKFTAPESASTYNVKGNVQEQSYYGRGMNVDTRI